MYADYIFYTDEYEGFRIPQERFGYFCRKASKLLDRYLSRAVTEADETPDLKCAVCELCDSLYAMETSRSAEGISSESIGDLSVTYKDTSGDKAVGSAVSAVLKAWLSDTDLIYCGVGYDT